MNHLARTVEALAKGLAPTAKKLAPVVAAGLHSTARREVVFKSQYADVQLLEKSIPDYVFKLSDGPVSEFGDRPALKEGQRCVSHNQLKQSVLSVAQSLQTQYGVKKDTVIGLLLPNSPEFGMSLHGAMAAGGIVTTINPVSTAWELAYQLKDSAATMMITSTSFLSTVIEANQSVNGQLKTIFVVGDEASGAHVPFSSLLENDGSAWKPVEKNWKNDVALLPYSSGTTGRPKGVMLTHFNIVNNIEQVRVPGILELTPDVRMLGLLPFYHVYGLVAIMNVGVAVGAATSCLAKFDPAEFLTTVQNDKLDVLHIVPPIALFMAKHPVVDNFNLSNMQEIVCAAAPLSKEVTDQLYQRFPNIRVIRQGYGMTELSPTCHVDSSDRSKTKIGSAGLLVPNTMCKVVELVTGRELGADESGEICIKGPQVMKGYLNNEKATRDTIDPDGWLHTGDVGYVTKDGHIFIEDRVKELIKVKGHQVAPAELEGLLLSHPAIADCCVVQKPDPRSGEVPKAFVVLKPDTKMDGAEIVAWANKNLSEYKHLVEVEFIDAIPKSAAGKILRRLLREQEKQKAVSQAKEAV